MNKKYTFFKRVSCIIFAAGLVLGLLILASALLSTNIIGFWQFVGCFLISMIVIQAGILASFKIGELAHEEWRKMQKTKSTKVFREGT